MHIVLPFHFIDSCKNISTDWCISLILVVYNHFVILTLRQIQVNQSDSKMHLLKKMFHWCFFWDGLVACPVHYLLPNDHWRRGPEPLQPYGWVDIDEGWMDGWMDALTFFRNYLRTTMKIESLCFFLATVSMLLFRWLKNNKPAECLCVLHDDVLHIKPVIH